MYFLRVFFGLTGRIERYVCPMTECRSNSTDTSNKSPGIGLSGSYVSSVSLALGDIAIRLWYVSYRMATSLIDLATIVTWTWKK